MERCFIISSITKSRTIGAINDTGRLTGRACLLKLSGACLGEKILSDPFHFFRCIKGASGRFNKF